MTNHHLDQRLGQILTSIETRMEENKITTDTLHSKQETAEYLGVSEALLNRWAWMDDGIGPRRIKIGRRVFYRFGDILDFIRERAAVATRSSRTPTPESLQNSPKPKRIERAVLRPDRYRELKQSSWRERGGPTSSVNPSIDENLD